jgi:RHS repeat-associated protein
VDPSGLGTFDLPLRFPGQRYDAETALHYNYFRDYDPSIGRYGESDPIGLLGGLNTYVYVEANPLRKSDPRGLIPAGADPECFRRGECKCATAECAAGLPPAPPNYPTELCCDDKKLAECTVGVPGTAADCRACAAWPSPMNPTCWLCGGGSIDVLVCLSKACPRVPKGKCKPPTSMCPAEWSAS